MQLRKRDERRRSQEDHTHDQIPKIINYLDQKNTTEIQGGNDSTEMDEWIN